MITTVVFDLDDTLYLEKDYVASGYEYIATIIEQLYGINRIKTYNQLTELPSTIGNLNSLYMLSAQSNQLEELPSSIGNLDSLGVLTLNRNQLTVFPTETEWNQAIKQLVAIRYAGVMVRYPGAFYFGDSHIEALEAV